MRALAGHSLRSRECQRPGMTLAADGVSRRHPVRIAPRMGGLFIDPDTTRVQEFAKLLLAD
eukprot:5519771-Pleurochrysis_carterae.AAC.3